MAKLGFLPTRTPRSGFMRLFALYAHSVLFSRHPGGLFRGSALASSLAHLPGAPVVMGLAAHVQTLAPRTFRRGRLVRRGPVLRRDRLFSDIFLRFLESFWGGRVLFIFVRNLWFSLSSVVFVQEHIFARRIVQYASRALRHQRGAWWWGARVLALAVHAHDPQLLVSWLQTRLRVMSLYAHRRYFRLLGLLLRGLALRGQAYGLRGFYMRLVGKISVVGNSMSRVWWTRGGLAAGANLQLKVAQGFTIVRTTTGCLGLTLLFFF